MVLLTPKGPPVKTFCGSHLISTGFQPVQPSVWREMSPYFTRWLTYSELSISHTLQTDTPAIWNRYQRIRKPSTAEIRWSMAARACSFTHNTVWNRILPHGIVKYVSSLYFWKGSFMNYLFFPTFILHSQRTNTKLRIKVKKLNKCIQKQIIIGWMMR